MYPYLFSVALSTALLAAAPTSALPAIATKGAIFAGEVFFANLFSAPDTDTDLKELALGSHLARQNLFKNVHHTKPDTATIDVMNREMPVGNQPVDDVMADYNNVNSAFLSK